MNRWLVVGIGTAMMALFAPTGAWGQASTFCVKATKTEAKPRHYTGGWTNKTCTEVSAAHEGESEKVVPSALSEVEQQEVKALLKYVKVESEGVSGKPTVRLIARMSKS